MFSYGRLQRRITASGIASGIFSPQEATTTNSETAACESVLKWLIDLDTLQSRNVSTVGYDKN